MKKERRSILIVEDEAIIAMEIKDRLELLGWNVCGMAVSGDEAVRLAGSCRPDLVLMDITLKGGRDGFETARLIKNAFEIPIVFLTASLDKDVASRIEAEGSPVWVSKPFDEKELVFALEEALTAKKGPPG